MVFMSTRKAIADSDEGRQAGAGGAAGPHYDPNGEKSHKGPHGAGHKGDLPVLTANATGINVSVLLPS